MDQSVTNFYTKNADQNYADRYDIEHGPRLDATVKRFKLDELHSKNILDVGGGRGFLGKRLPKDNTYFVIDGAEIAHDQRMRDGVWLKHDLDRDYFAEKAKGWMPYGQIFDIAFCLEVLEHLSNPYNCLAEIKKLVKKDGDIIVSIPHISVTHNYIYPGLMADPRWFEQFLGQMALPIQEYWLWDQGWKAHHWRCRNADWKECKMLFPKNEAKFIGATPVEYVNY